ncbi:MAG: hypothetical protein RIB58_06340 [Phycisphaerales bacterium]
MIHRRCSATPLACVFAGLLLCIALASGCASVPTAANSKAAAASGRADASRVEDVTVDRVAGSWSGVFLERGWPVRLDLTLNAQPQGASEVGPRAIEGQARFAPMGEPGQAGREGPRAGSHTVRGTFDPITRTVGLRFSGWIERPGRYDRIPRLNLDLVLAVSPDAMAGDVGGLGMNTGSVVLVRPGEAERIMQTMEAHLGGRSAKAERAGRQVMTLFSGAPSEDQLRNWFARVVEEYPGTSVRRGIGGVASRERADLMLFDDDWFAEHFGATYDALSANQRFAIERRLSGMGRSREEITFATSRLADRFNDDRHRAVREVMMAVLARRAIGQWLTTAGLRLERWPASEDTFDQLAAMGAAIERRTPILWPSERAAAAAPVERAATRLAAPVLRASLERLTAASPSEAAIGALNDWPAAHADVLFKATAAQRDALERDRVAAIDAMLEPLLASEPARLAALGEGAQAVEAGSAWYRGLVDRLGPAVHRPPVRTMVDGLRATRDAQLDEATPALAASLAGLSDAASIDQRLEAILVVPGDRRTQAAERLQAAARQRKAELDREAFLAMFSPSERPLIRADGSVAVPARHGPPDAQDIRVAILREFASIGGSRLSPERTRYTFFPLDIMGSYYLIEVRSVEVLNTARLDDGSWAADYTVSLHVSIDGSSIDRLLDGSIQGRMMDAMLREINTAPPTRLQSVFRLTPSGWRSPTWRDVALEGMANVLERATEAIEGIAGALPFP